MDTIFALATAPGRAGVAIVRVSGPDIEALCNVLGLGTVPPRKPVLRSLAIDGEVIDNALILRFERGSSFTGEEVLELHLHGSIAIRDAALGALARVPGCRMADPGEFTRRALENGRMDLTEVEGLAALIDAETEAQRKQAQRVLSGALREKAEAWRQALVEALAYLEVTIDFADEEVPVDVTPDVLTRLDGVLEDLSAEVDGSRIAERVRDGFEVAIVGAPNAGKSTLLNAIAGRSLAITSDVPGTTRDVIEAHMVLEGLPVTFLDTAGLRETEDTVEGLGVERTLARAADADLRVFLRSAGDTPYRVDVGPDDIEIWGKADLNPAASPSVSGTTGAGLDDLLSRVSRVLADRAARVGVAIDVRHRNAIGVAHKALTEARAGMVEGTAESEIVAEHIRTALDQLDHLVGRVGVEDILDVVFSRFCLGK